MLPGLRKAFNLFYYGAGGDVKQERNTEVSVYSGRLVIRIQGAIVMFFYLPHPLCPPLLSRRGGRIYEEGLRPSLKSLPLFGWREDKG